jgi:hypothetical protein
VKNCPTKTGTSIITFNTPEAPIEDKFLNHTCKVNHIGHGRSEQSPERLLKPISRISKIGGRLPKMRTFSGKVEETVCASQPLQMSAKNIFPEVIHSVNLEIKTNFSILVFFNLELRTHSI